jgi:hypothetical protein
MERRRQAAREGRQVILMLLLAVPIMLAAPAAGQTPDAGAPAPTDLIDPDCYSDLALLALVEDPALMEDPQLVEEPDGICSPDDGSSPPPDGPGAEPAPPPPAGGPGVEPAPESPVSVPEEQLIAPFLPSAPSAPSQPYSTDEGPDEPTRTVRGTQPNRRGSGGGAYAEPEDSPRPERRGRGPRSDGSTGLGDLGAADVLPGPSTAVGVPNFVVRGSTVPRFLRGIYQAAEARYGVRWEILAAINEIETYYGRNLNISSAGAVGWMQFMPGTWHAYGTDANHDGAKNPYDPEDAIFSAARYLKASGYAHDVRAALFAYNHAGWYVDDVLVRARRIAAENVSLPAARRLDSAFAARLERIAGRAGVPWELTLAVLRVRGMDGEVPATSAQLRRLVRRLVLLGARTDPRGALRRLAKASPSGLELGPRLLTREPTFVQRVVALAHYNKAVGRVGLVRGLGAVKQQLARRVLGSPRLVIYPGGRVDIAKGVTDEHVLLLLAYLSSRYDEVRVTSLTTGHGLFTASGNVSAHSYGRAVDVAALNGTPVLGHQEPGGLTEQALWRMLLLPAELEPTELISLFALGGPSFDLADHADHIHVGY